MAIKDQPADHSAAANCRDPALSSTENCRSKVVTYEYYSCYDMPTLSTKWGLFFAAAAMVVRSRKSGKITISISTYFIVMYRLANAHSTGRLNEYRESTFRVDSMISLR
jgi:hypothetical protein